MNERSWIFSLVTLLAVFLSYEVIAGKNAQKEQLILTEYSPGYFSGSYAQEERRLRFEASMDNHNILAFAVQTERAEHRGVVAVDKLDIMSAPGEGDLSQEDTRLLFDLVEALKADATERSEPPSQALTGLIGALSYWVMRAPG
ncbi:MAG: hypothetical protein IPM37_18965 [Hahellaceae bacterium]|nr:hypothetical protein [Hahellaceae bacterium]